MKRHCGCGGGRKEELLESLLLLLLLLLLLWRVGLRCGKGLRRELAGHIGRRGGLLASLELRLLEHLLPRRGRPLQGRTQRRLGRLPLRPGLLLAGDPVGHASRDGGGR